MKILGIDPGLQTIGFALLDNGVLQDFGVIKTDSGLPLSDRLTQIFEDMTELISDFSPNIAAIEQLFFVQNVTNGMAVAHARGVILMALNRKGIPTTEVLPKEVKIAVCGQGNAPKLQVQKAVQQIFKLESLPRPDDAADAIAIAFWQTRQKI